MFESPWEKFSYELAWDPHALKEINGGAYENSESHIQDTAYAQAPKIRFTSEWLVLPYPL